MDLPRLMSDVNFAGPEGATIYVTRHGQRTANLTHVFSNHGAGHPLTALGERQADQLGRRLAGRGIATIHTSPIVRATQTAERVSAFTGARFHVTEALREQDAGRLEGRSDPEGWRLHAEVLDDRLLHGGFRSRLPEAESFGDIANRFLPFVRDLGGYWGVRPAHRARRNAAGHHL